MPHYFFFGHLYIVRRFYKDWASDANFIQTFGYYMSLNWKRYFPGEERCPPIIYLDVWPIATPMAFSMEAYVSNQMEMGKILLAKSPMQGEFLGPISNGKDLNCMHGEEWKTWRSRFNPGFGKSNIRQWVPAILEEVETFAGVLQNLSGKAGAWGPVFQLEKVAGDLALDATGRIILNHRLHSQTASPSKFTQVYREQLQRMEITLNLPKLIWRTTPMFKSIITRKRRELYDFLRPFILQSFGSRAPSGKRTIIQAALEECKHEKPDTRPSADPDEPFIEMVFCQLMIFFFGGDDAISIIIPWMFKQLQSHPECVAKLRQEHDKVFGTDLSAAAHQIREMPHLLDSLPVTQAVIKETLRIHPATITIRMGQPDFTFHITGSNMEWPSDGFDLFDSSITIHRDPQNFPNPLDFIPERWMAPQGHSLYPPKNVWRAFQLGPRKCIGQEMAYVVLKLVLVLVVRRFDIEMAWDEWDDLQTRMGHSPSRKTVNGDRMYTTGKATSHPKDGAPVHVRARTVGL
ncbi:hypothetical protein CDD82_4450 [Ophiocordyceps australis]|uniref:Cytochrome P450 n=1 Tax=Ophiocordyceps australis TaxID=1399860 RepID=A0A2C5Z8F2_9HYPO|nr:hypothetical protein CDD82_4450 [Ophiocordyceps australis]